MKNKSLIILILLIIGSGFLFIIYNNKKQSDSDDDTLINRKTIYTETVLLDVNENIYTMPRLSFSYNESKFLAYQVNNKSVSINEYSTNSSKLINSNIIDIDSVLTISSFNSDFLYYINNSSMFIKINRETLKKEKICDSVYNAFPINEKEFFIFSTVKKKDKFHIGVFKLKDNKELDTIQISQSDTIYRKENILLYDGYFTQHTGGYFSYTYYNIPEIILFNRDLTYKKTFILTDKKVTPNIYTRNNTFILSQGSKSFTKGVHLDQNKEELIVFSNYYNQYDYGFLLDYYSIESGQYNNSKIIQIKNKIINNSYIQKVYSNEKKNVKIYSFGDILSI
ncbi:hypothetical protein [Myroides profundi]|uniref:Uncharacterized protein n=1 Tax=Myroides profundi TaxID=480520 RepID=A0AAJ4W1J1_MYRPR|nr:hypothetical protein [Myroides profundi]AJH14810.1 hypothetical protein MPR_1630 [Myroides profundi]SEQ23180.1 hypothetical protein SAMN04488089_102126 [Myroides profundi]